MITYPNNGRDSFVKINTSGIIKKYSSDLFYASLSKSSCSFNISSDASLLLSSLYLLDRMHATNYWNITAENTAHFCTNWYGLLMSQQGSIIKSSKLQSLSPTMSVGLIQCILLLPFIPYLFCQKKKSVESLLQAESQPMLSQFILIGMTKMQE